jgi:cytochrome c556
MNVDRNRERTLAVLWGGCLALAVAAGGTVLGGCAGQASAAPAPTVRDLMVQRVIPLSDVVFRVGAEEPADATAWRQVRDSAVALSDAASLLLDGSLRQEDAVWLDSAQALVTAANAAADAAARRDVDGVLAIGGDIYTTCERCHARFLPGRGGS